MPLHNQRKQRSMHIFKFYTRKQITENILAEEHQQIKTSSAKISPIGGYCLDI